MTMKIQIEIKNPNSMVSKVFRKGDHTHNCLKKQIVDWAGPNITGEFVEVMLKQDSEIFVECRFTQNEHQGKDQEIESSVEFSDRVKKWIEGYVSPILPHQQALYDAGWDRVWKSPDGLCGWWWIHPNEAGNLHKESSATIILNRVNKVLH